MPLQLRRLTESDEAAFFEGLKDWSEAERSWYTFAWKPGMSYAEMLREVAKESDGVDLPDTKVPATMYYGFVDGKIVGRLHVRHRLNEYLRRRGGHIGYAVAPRYRGNGYATQMLEQALPICARVGIQDLLLTCGDENVVSWKLIEKFGGTLEGKFWDEQDKIMFRRYWLKL